MTAKNANFNADVPNKLAELTFVIDFSRMTTAQITAGVQQLQTFLQSNAIIKQAIKPRTTPINVVQRKVAADTPLELLNMVNSYDFTGLNSPLVRPFRSKAEKLVEEYIRKQFPTR